MQPSLIMTGKPLGAKHLRPIPDSLKNYQGIAGIEFIEQNQKTDDVRSVAYRVVDDGAQTRIRTSLQDDLVDSDLNLKEANSYIDSLVGAGIFDWDYSYRPSQGNFTNVNIQWRLKIEFNPSYEQAPFICEGESLFPDNYESIIEILLYRTPFK